jgi:polyphosphate kinase
MKSAATKSKPMAQAKAAALPRTLVHNRHLLLSREVSWIEFNRRVLEEALDQRHPLLERLKFLAIFSTNMDEFFMVRVSGLKEALDAGVETSLDGMKTSEQLKEISARLRPLLDHQHGCLQTEIIPALAKKGIVLKSYQN